MPYVPMLVAAGLEGFVGLLAIIMSLTSCICIRTYGDNARRGFWWLWYTYFFLFLGGASIAVNCGWLSFFLSYTTEGWMHYLPGPDIIPFHAGRFFIRVVNVLMFLMISKLAMALLYVWGQHHKKHRVFHHLVHLLCLIQLGAAIAALAGSTTFYWDRLMDERLKPFKYIAVATDCLWFIFFTFTMGLCVRVIVVGKRRGKAYNRKVPDLLLASAVFTWASALWGAAFSVNFNIRLKELEIVHFIVPNVCFLYFDFIAVTLIFAAGRRKRGGLYSIERPEQLPRKLHLGSAGFHNYEGVSLNGPDGEDEPLRAHGAEIDGTGAVYSPGHGGPNKFHYPPEKGPGSPEVKGTAGHYEYA